MHQVLLPENVPFDSGTFTPGTFAWKCSIWFRYFCLKMDMMDMEEEEDEENLFKQVSTGNLPSFLSRSFGGFVLYTTHWKGDFWVKLFRLPTGEIWFKRLPCQRCYLWKKVSFKFFDALDLSSCLHHIWTFQPHVPDCVVAPHPENSSISQVTSRILLEIDGRVILSHFPKDTW